MVRWIRFESSLKTSPLPPACHALLSSLAPKSHSLPSTNSPSPPPQWLARRSLAKARADVEVHERKQAIAKVQAAARRRSEAFSLRQVKIDSHQMHELAAATSSRTTTPPPQYDGGATPMRPSVASSRRVSRVGGGFSGGAGLAGKTFDQILDPETASRPGSNDGQVHGRNGRPSRVSSRPSQPPRASVR